MSTQAGKTVRIVGLMMAATVLAKLLGLLRSVWLASLYGAGMEAEAFSAASRLTLTVFDVVLGAAVAVCFIPLYNRCLAEGEEEARRFTDRFISLIILLTAAVSAVGMIASAGVIALMAPGLDEQTARLASSLLQKMLPMILFSGLAACWTGVLQSHGRFLLPAVMSAVSNAFVLLYFWLFNSRFGIQGLAVAYLLAWMLQCVVLLPGLCRIRFRFRPSLALGDEMMRKAYRMAPQAMVSSWLTPVMTAAGLFFASMVKYTGERPVPCLEYATQLLLIASGVIVYAVCNYVFPSLSKLEAEGDGLRFRVTLRQALTAALTVVVPISLILCCVSHQAVSVVYERGQFSAQATVLTAETLANLAPAMIAMAVTELLNRAFFAKGKGRVPTVASLVGMAVFLLACVLFVSVWGRGIQWIARAMVLGQAAAAAVLCVAVLGEDRGFFDRDFLREMGKLVPAGAGCWLGAEAVKRGLALCWMEEGFWTRLLTAGVSAVMGLLIFLIVAWLLKSDPLRQLLKKKTEGEDGV